MRRLRITACMTVWSLVATAGLLAQAPTVRQKPTALVRHVSAATAGSSRVDAVDDVSEQRPVTMRLSARMAFAPAVIRSVIRVAPHADNRRLRLTLDSPDFYRSSDIELDGASAASAHYFNWSALPAGSYTVVATLFGPDGQRAQTFSTLDVRGFGSR
jgi:hypothetical protein